MATTFKEATKRELLTVLPGRPCCVRAFLSAVAKAAGSLEGAGRRQTLCIQLDSLEAAEAVAGMLKTLYPVEPCVAKHILQPDTGAERTIYTVSLQQGFARQVLEDFELVAVTDEGLYNFNRRIPQQLLRKECCMQAYFQGLYLVCGSVYVPEQSEDGKNSQGYHFELQVTDGEFADSIMELLSDLRINTKISERGSLKLVYAKDRDEIVRILCVLSLADSATRLRDIINERDTANLLNRAVICETANMDKIFAAASRLVLAIARLKDRGEYDALPSALKETAEARTRYPEASMQELADILQVSKSCLHHRLKKIEAFAEELD